MSEAVDQPVAHDDFTGADGPIGGWSTLQPANYMTARRQMNIHDFLDPEEGGFRLVNALDSARAELQQFMEMRDLRPSEPLEVRILIEVEARTEPVPTDG